MAGTLLKMGSQFNRNVMEFVVDTEDEIQYLPTHKSAGTGTFSNNPDVATFAPIGSTCIVGNETGNVKVYMLFSFGWKEL